MFDPLNSTTSVFANGDTDAIPPWPTTPHEPNSPIPTLRRASPSAPRNVDSDPAFVKEPRIYGQPEPGLISPHTAVGSNGIKFEKKEPYLRVRITGLDRNRRDILVKFDAQTNLSNFTGTTYRNVSRSYLEFQQFYEALLNSCPHTIIPALPLAQTSAPTDEEDDRLVRIMLQRWLTRICEDPVVMYDEDLRSFIESDFGYQPMPRPRRKTGSGFSLIKRDVADEDEVLQRARFELTKLETQFFDAAKAIDKLAITRRALSAAHAEMGNKLVNVASTEARPPLANALRKLGRTWHSLSDLDQAQSISECVVIGDTFGYQGMNARSAKEALLQRAGVLEEYQAAVKSAISKRRNIERLKVSSNIRPERVDEALEELEEANKYEQLLAQRANGISQNLHRALQVHSKTVTDDVTVALVEHARSSIMYEKQLLRELLALKNDVSNADQKIVVQPNSIPKPSIIPPLEDNTKTASRPIASAPPVPQLSSSVPAVASTSSASIHNQGPITSSQIAGPSTGVRPPVSTSPPPPASLSGGRFQDGTQSMFVQSTGSPRGQPPPASSSTPISRDPLLGTASCASSSSPLTRPLSLPSSATPDPSRRFSASQATFGPLAQLGSTSMSQSMRIQPSRPRLDAKLAASKLANMF
ncbi:Vps5 C terminal like-domain-containing protein [Pisolithus orientalis]|uniref:Vps5 C terminal like-domain-containing protein n=1 Tax=Pisolithus orientalis TaxID=936130 RepID=UPI0022256474|nr:Vps5 C terminal like-domain-containing protein [Pisolithus orientalis]KAI6035047.1 Vps5 C terminal like-domain-containing protein [Pisolithus orientalis]